MITTFLSAMAIAFSGAVMPGPLLTYTVRQAFSGGLKSGLTIMLGHALLELITVTLIFLGFDVILQSQTAQIAIGLVGGLLLTYMGVSMAVGALRNTVTIALSGTASSKSMVASGFFISASNPYFLLWWAIIGLGFLLAAYKAFGMWGAGVWFVGHIATDFLWYGFIAWVVGKTRRFISQNLYRWIVGLLGGMLVYFGVSFVVSAVSALGK
jgi:threonine/homoserine/homoserine lactone efflux protein